jgi:hypothetical protein
MDLYQNDEVLANNNLEQFSLKASCQGDVYETYSNRKVKAFPLYSLEGPQLRLVANQETPVLNFNKLKSLLLSEGTSKIDEYRALTSKGLLFLDKKEDLVGNRVALASFPRTGNSFLRKILEQITGNFTGSDMSLDFTVIVQQQGMLGE